MSEKKHKTIPELSIVIPFYNDSGCPIPFVSELKKELEGINYEIILVDDCSKDSTPKEIETLKCGNVKAIYNSVNKQYGGAITTGLDKARGKIIGFTCGDGEVSPKDVVNVYKKMGNFDIAKAIRQNRQDGLKRIIISKIFNFWTRLRFGIELEDINGYPVYFKREIYERLENLRKDWIFNTDLLRKIINLGYQVQGIEIIHQKRSEGQSHMTLKRISGMVIKYLGYR